MEERIELYNRAVCRREFLGDAMSLSKVLLSLIDLFQFCHEFHFLKLCLYDSQVSILK